MQNTSTHTMPARYRRDLGARFKTFRDNPRTFLGAPMPMRRCATRRLRLTMITGTFLFASMIVIIHVPSRALSSAPNDNHPTCTLGRWDARTGYDRSYRCEYCRRAAGAFPIRAYRALLPPHAPDVLTVPAAPVIDGTRALSPCQTLSLVGCSLCCLALSSASVPLSSTVPCLQSPPRRTERVNDFETAGV